MGLENIVLSEVTQTEEDKTRHALSHQWLLFPNGQL